MIVLTYDHGGFEIKDVIIKYLNAKGLEYVDVNGKLDPTDSYVEYGKKANAIMEQDSNNIGIYICRSGAGMTIVANRSKAVRAVNCITEKLASMGRKHNNANVCVIPADYLSEEEMINILDTFLNTEFEGGRHEARVQALSK